MRSLACKSNVSVHVSQPYMTDAVTAACADTPCHGASCVSTKHADKDRVSTAAAAETACNSFLQANQRTAKEAGASGVHASTTVLKPQLKDCRLLLVSSNEGASAPRISAAMAG